jgi:hypothetical protein
MQDRELRSFKLAGTLGKKCGQGQNRTAATRIFSPLSVAGLCDTIGRYVYLFKRLTAVRAGRFYRFEHIMTYSSGKVAGKVMRITQGGS